MPEDDKLLKTVDTKNIYHKNKTIIKNNKNANLNFEFTFASREIKEHK